jgi:hypothetical protein
MVADKDNMIGATSRSYMGLTRTLGALQGLNQTKDAMGIGYNQGNKYDTRLGTNALRGKRNTWGPQKYAELKRDGMDKTMGGHRLHEKQKRNDDYKKKQKALAIGIGSTVGALCLASALTTGNALAPFEIMAKGIKRAPGLLFDRAKNNQYGGTARTLANGLDKAVKQTKVESRYALYNSKNNGGSGFNQSPSSNFGTNKDVRDVVNTIIGGVATGLATGVGTYGAQLLSKHIQKEGRQN